MIPGTEPAPVYPEFPGRALEPRAMHPRHRARRSLPAASILVSIGLHAALLALGAVVVYEAATSTPRAGRDIVIDFDTPGQGQAAPAAPRAPSPGAAIVLADPPAPRAPEPREPPALTGLSSALSSSPAATGLPGSDASSLDSLFAAAADPATSSARPDETVTFAGLGASSARSVVYVVDCSGPMVTSLPMVLAEVRRSVSALSPTQKFGVILFRRLAAAPVVESFAPLLVRATPSAQERLGDWLATAEPTGRSSPLAGLEAALALRPDAVFLLSRSIDRSGGAVWDDGFTATMTRLEQLNPRDTRGRRPVSIHTIQFLDEDPTGTLQAIGTQHGGGKASYRVIRRSEDLSSR